MLPFISRAAFPPSLQVSRLLFCRASARRTASKNADTRRHESLRPSNAAGGGSQTWYLAGGAAALALLGGFAMSRNSLTAKEDPKKQQPQMVAPLNAAADTKAKIVLDAAWAVVQGAQFPSLCTLDKKGAPSCRAMQPHFPDPTFSTIALATNPRSSKVKEVLKDPRCGLMFMDANGPAYVYISGRITVHPSLEERRRRWVESWALFYPDGPDKGFVPLEFTADRIQVVSVGHGVPGSVVPETSAWTPPTLERGFDGRWALVEPE